jgi:hypothetical protein
MKNIDNILWKIENFFVPINKKTKSIDHTFWLTHSIYYQKKHGYLFFLQLLVFIGINLLLKNILIIGFLGTFLFFTMLIASICFVISIYYNMLNIFSKNQ